MLGGLYGDPPPPSSAAEEEKSSSASTVVWSGSVKMAPTNFRKPFSGVAARQTVLKSQKPKTVNFSLKPVSPMVAPPVSRDEVVHPALVGVTSTVIKEYDPSRSNDYEEYKREKKRKAMEAKMRRELGRRRQEEEERERERGRRGRKQRGRENGNTVNRGSTFQGRRLGGDVL